IAPAIAQAEQQRAMRKPPDSLDAWAAYQRGLWHLSKLTSEDTALAQDFFQRAIDHDPAFSGGYVGLAMTDIHASDFRFLQPGLHEAMSSMEILARRALALDGADAEARSLLANALWVRADYEGAVAEAEQALAAAPNLAFAHHMRGTTLVFSGRPKEGVAALQRSIRLDPRHPKSAMRLNQMAVGLYFSRDYAATVEAAKRAIRSYPDFPPPYRWLAAALGQLGRREEAKEALQQALAVFPDAFETNVRNRVPWMRSEDHAHMLEGLRKAG